MNNEGKTMIWSQYQKEIATDNFFYLRSCVRQNFFPGSETAFLRILKDLGKNFYEDPAHTTCTGIGYHCDIVPQDTMMTIVARQFALMTEAGFENLVPSCITSFGLYTEVLHTWHEFPKIEERIHELLFKSTGREFQKPKNLAHASDIMYSLKDEIASKSKYRLVNVHTGKPLRVVDHIGCHYAKMFPAAGIGGAEYPAVLTGMIEAWGGETVDYPERRHCCGFGFRQYLVKANRGFSVACSHAKFESMEPFKPDMIITNCPGCPMFLDKWQYTIAEMTGKTYDETGYGIPVFTYEEVAGLMLGYDPWEIGLQVHQISAEPVLDKMGIPYDSSKKYLGIGGKQLGSPTFPEKLSVAENPIVVEELIDEESKDDK